MEVVTAIARVGRAGCGRPNVFKKNVAKKSGKRGTQDEAK